MSIIDRARLFLARGMIKGVERAWETGRFPEWVDYAFVEPTFRMLVNEGYRANAAVFACAAAMAFAFIEPKLRVYQYQDGGGAKELPTHPLAKLFRQPMSQTWPTFSGTMLQQGTIINAQIGGNGYWHKIRSGSGKVVELVPHNDATLSPIEGKTKPVDHYEFTGENGETKDVPVEDVVHFMWIWDPLSPWKGMAPLVAAAREVDTDNEAGLYVYRVLKNDAVPRLALIAPKDADWSDKDKRAALRQSWIEMHGGDNRGLPAVLWDGMDVKRLSLDLGELAFEALRRLPETRIASAMRVPPVIAGLLVGLENSGGLNSNAQQAAKWMTERTLVPLWQLFGETITASFDKDFELSKNGIYVAYDLSTVVSLQEALNEKRTWASNALRAGGITVNDFRKMVGLPLDEKGGDIYLRTAGTLAVPFGALPTPAPALPAGNGPKGHSQENLAKSLPSTVGAHGLEEKTGANAMAVVGEYATALSQFVVDAFAGTMNAIDMARAHRALVRTLGPKAYYAGMRDGGIDSPEEELEATDEDTISQWTANQLAYVRDFAVAAVDAANDTLQQDAIMQRVDLWVNALESLAAQATMNAQANGMLTWRMGKTKEHCTTCKTLHGKRHRASWFLKQGFIPREPGSETLECHGFACECGLYNDRGKKVI